MRKKRGLLAALLCFAALSAGVVCWWLRPSPITRINPGEVAWLNLFEYSEGGIEHGGKQVTISDLGDIKYIFENFNSVND